MHIWPDTAREQSDDGSGMLRGWDVPWTRWWLCLALVPPVDGGSHDALAHAPAHTEPPSSPPKRYNKLCGHITSLVARLKALKPEDEFRIKMTDEVGGK